MKNKKVQKQARHTRVRKKLGAKNPRLIVFRSNKFTYAQIVDDTGAKTLASASDLKMKSQKSPKLEKAKEVGASLAKIAIKKNVKKVVFDRSGYKYHGRVKAVAEGARSGGLEF